jgi:transcriptional regulator with XRE-family HTH domain
MLKSLGEKIQNLREEYGVSQEKLATHLDITRQTLSQVESNNRMLKVDELKKLSEFFNIEVEYFLREENTVCNTEYPFSKNKFKNLLLYILEKCGSKPNVGETVIYKLLYFSDFGFYQKYKKHLSGATYVKMPFGPAPCDFSSIVEKMIDNKKIQKVITEYNGFMQKKYIPLVNADMSEFEKDEIDFIDKIIDKYSNYSARDISSISHEQIPWRIADYNKLMKYEDLDYSRAQIA